MFTLGDQFFVCLFFVQITSAKLNFLPHDQQQVLKGFQDLRSRTTPAIEPAAAATVMIRQAILRPFCTINEISSSPPVYVTPENEISIFLSYFCRKWWSLDHIYNNAICFQSEVRVREKKHVLISPSNLSIVILKLDLSLSIQGMQYVKNQFDSSRKMTDICYIFFAKRRAKLYLY